MTISNLYADQTRNKVAPYSLYSSMQRPKTPKLILKDVIYTLDAWSSLCAAIIHFRIQNSWAGA